MEFYKHATLNDLRKQVWELDSTGGWTKRRGVEIQADGMRIGTIYKENISVGLDKNYRLKSIILMALAPELLDFSLKALATISDSEIDEKTKEHLTNKFKLIENKFYGVGEINKPNYKRCFEWKQEDCDVYHDSVKELKKLL